jgi:hypothetical protein
MALSDPEEERLVAELELLGIHYLSRQTPERAASVRPPADLLADLIRQPSARVRTAVIAVLLSHPDLVEALPAALERLSPPEQQTLLFFYTAAVLLQQQYAPQLQPYVGWQPLPDRFAVDLGLPPGAPIRERLAALGRRQRQQTGKAVNWTGTYEQVVRHLLRSWELECHFEAVLPRAVEADIIPQEFRENFKSGNGSLMSDPTVPAPIGEYNPDWTIVWQGQRAFGESQAKLHLVCETNGSLDDAPVGTRT